MSPDHPRHLPVVMLAALYGAGGTVVGPRVAERLGVPFLDREISETVAKRTGLPESAIAEIDQDPRSDRLVANLGRASTISGALGEFTWISRSAGYERTSRSSWPRRAAPEGWRSDVAAWSSCARYPGRARPSGRILRVR
jgi:hypothetical protein